MRISGLVSIAALASLGTMIGISTATAGDYDYYAPAPSYHGGGGYYAQPAPRYDNGGYYNAPTYAPAPRYRAAPSYDSGY